MTDFSITEALDTKTGKYFLERKKGKNKKQSAIDAGFADGHHTGLIERSQTFQGIQKYFKDEALEQITRAEITSELIKNIKQDQDKGAKNKAIEMVKDWIEPETAPSQKEEAVMVVFKK